ncbi:MAG: hypothetical protein QF442_03145 [Candidatus Peribacteraceae bacterium]|jgi:hypothetical protein|nr:hypothetical protein [Candidatus Peribacteraceae bacterium]|tara:strand:- start:472 stop:741 length:270 start_codon:yes stop_codon:yes gene_type:complete
MPRFIYAEENPSPDDIHIDGIVILNDADSFTELEGCRVIVFNETKAADDALDRLRSEGDLDIAFQAALDGHAEELSVSRLVKFYLANGM